MTDVDVSEDQEVTNVIKLNEKNGTEVTPEEQRPKEIDEKMKPFMIDMSIELLDPKGERMRTQTGFEEDEDEEFVLDDKGELIPIFEFMTVGSTLYAALGAFKEKDEPSMKVKRWRGGWRKRVAAVMDNGDLSNPEATGDTNLKVNKMSVSFLLKQVHLSYVRDINIYCAMCELLDPDLMNIDIDGEEPE